MNLSQIFWRIGIDPSLPEGIKQLLLSLETPANLPFSRESWTYGLLGYLAKVDQPVLVVIGKKDLQSDWKTWLPKRNLLSFVYPENADHVLKHEETPIEKLTSQHAALHYNSPNAKLYEETKDAILNWLRRDL